MLVEYPGFTLIDPKCFTPRANLDTFNADAHKLLSRSYRETSHSAAFIDLNLHNDNNLGVTLNSRMTWISSIDAVFAKCRRHQLSRISSSRPDDFC